MTSFPLNVANVQFVEALYAEYLRDPASVPEDWRAYFDSLIAEGDFLQASVEPTFGMHSDVERRSRQDIRGVLAPRDLEVAVFQERVDQLVRSYRVRGHMIARIDPLGAPRGPEPELELAFHGLSEEDLDRIVSTDTIPGAETQTLREVIERLQNTYCRSIGVEFMHIDEENVRQWLRERMESTENRINLSRKDQLRILTRLTDAVVFEQFIQRKFTGAKRFSLEGAESLIPLLDLAIEKAGEQGINEIVIAMAHRGRLNVLANIMGKHPQEIFREFEDVDAELYLGRGDVKYHLGYSSDWKTASGRRVHLSLCFNPSHLEFVNPVALGRTRAKQDLSGDTERTRSMCLLIHGDAAFPGEGIVQETLNLSELDAYRVGGTLHIIVNNQIGFTTGPHEARSSKYATDVAKMLQSPIFHVNGEDPEAVAQVVDLAMDFRRTFHRDVVIDMYGYRRWGHNEGDEPAFTQPLLYEQIAKRQGVREGYLRRLLKLGGITQDEADRIAVTRQNHLEKALSVARSEGFRPSFSTLQGKWSGYKGGPDASVEEVETGVPVARLGELLRRMTELPAGFTVHRKLERFLAARREMAAGKRPLDWATAEALAFATLATEGHRVRLTGQDSERGTFSQRHAVLHDVKTGEQYRPLQHLAPDQAPVEIYNSPLSEAAVLGFEYGYSLDAPDALVAWEAQFGDFVNVAQVIIDQFISSAEEKWNRLSGLVMLLPHGFEGQGPEHSSARLERFLSLAAEDNMQVVNPTTPAQYFHLLRRQVLRPWRKPLIVMTPKSLLRHPRAVSSLDELSVGTFRRLLPDEGGAAPDAIQRILLCSGKLYYELVERREALKRRDVAILRLEQYYPFPLEQLRQALAPYPPHLPVVWVQEEPENMGAWPYLRFRFGVELCGRPLLGICRPESASPATGSASSHKLEQQRLIDEAFR